MSHTHIEPDHNSPPATPLWVKVFASIVIVVVLLVGILHVTGNGLGGPGSHTSPIEHSMPQP
jgi:hypothetical protein